MVSSALEGHRESLEYLALSHPPIQGMIGSLSRRLDPGGSSRKDLRAAARLGIVEALRRFRPGGKARFRTYAFNYIRGEMIKALYSQAQRRERAAGRLQSVTVVSLSAQPTDEVPRDEEVEGDLFARDDRYGAEPGYAEVERRGSEQAVRGFVGALPANQREIVTDLFWSELSHAEAARARGVSRPAVSRTMQRVCAKGRRELAGHLECLAA